MMHPSLFIGADAKDYLLTFNHGYWITGILVAGLAVWFKFREKKKEQAEYPTPTTIQRLVMPHERVGDIVIIAAISGILGSKLLYMTENTYTTMEAAMNDFFSGSGLSVYGGMIAGFLAVSYYIHKKQIPFRQLLDASSPAIFIAYGVGRLGCHFSGDGDWGDTNRFEKPFAWLPDWLWGYRYPNNVINEGQAMEECYYPKEMGDFCHQLAEPAFVTPVYEFIMSVIIFLILWKLRHSIRAHGLLFFIFLIFNGLERYLIEIVRLNDDYQMAGLELSQAQYIAIVLFSIGVVGTILMYRKQRELVAAEREL
jgi:prolipoprotein diacylglyceryl transferase